MTMTTMTMGPMMVALVVVVKVVVLVGRIGCLPAYGDNDNSRDVSCSKPSLHCRKLPREGALSKWLTRSASDAMHMALYK